MLVDSKGDQRQGARSDHLHQPGMPWKQVQQQYHHRQVAKVVEQGGDPETQPLASVSPVDTFNERPPFVAVITHDGSQQSTEQCGDY